MITLNLFTILAWANAIFMAIFLFLSAVVLDAVIKDRRADDAWVVIALLLFLVTMTILFGLNSHVFSLTL